MSLVSVGDTILPADMNDKVSRAGGATFKMSGSFDMGGNAIHDVTTYSGSNLVLTGSGTVGVSLNNIQVRNLRIENTGSNPAGGNAGRLVWNTGNNELRVDDGSTFTSFGTGITFRQGHITYNIPATILPSSGSGGTGSYSIFARFQVPSGLTSKVYVMGVSRTYATGDTTKIEVHLHTGSTTASNTGSTYLVKTGSYATLDGTLGANQVPAGGTVICFIANYTNAEITGSGFVTLLTE